MPKKIGMLSLRGGGVDESFGLGLQQRLHTVVALGGEVHGHQPRRHDDSLDRPSQDERRPRNFRCASCQPSGTQVHLWKTPPGGATSGFVQLISDVVHFSPVPSSWLESNSSSLANFMSPIFRKLESNFPKIGMQIYVQFLWNSDRFWTLKCAVQFLIQFLLSYFFGHGSVIF